MKNKKIWIAAATLLATGIAVALVKKLRSNKQISEPASSKKSHHLTDVFAHAKGRMA